MDSAGCLMPQDELQAPTGSGRAPQRFDTRHRPAKAA
jgi:hypothetical protein